MKSTSLLLLRVSLGLLMLIWGIDKVANVKHAAAVSKGFYLDLISAPIVFQALGALQIVLALLIIVGLLRRITYPILLVITGITLLAVWRSIVDPLNMYMGEGGNILFFPSLTVFFGALVLLAFQAEDRIAIDKNKESV